MASKIAFLLNQPQAAAELAARGKQAVDARYNWAAVAARLDSLLRSLRH
jgi:glycosyltransferase involved in cell wall biosynthesis